MIKEGRIMGEREEFLRKSLRNVPWNRPGTQSGSGLAQDLGINRNMPARWMRKMKRSETGSMKAFTGKGNARDEETARLRKENAGLREANEILKKR
ncbi:MAG: hypothetical protein LBB61_03455 [Treponema sp.]|jgi:transposase|nr:hypothetical protein [Treponema sp.]